MNCAGMPHRPAPVVPATPGRRARRAGWRRSRRRGWCGRRMRRPPIACRRAEYHVGGLIHGQKLAGCTAAGKRLLRPCVVTGLQTHPAGDTPRANTHVGVDALGSGCPGEWMPWGMDALGNGCPGEWMPWRQADGEFIAALPAADMEPSVPGLAASSSPQTLIAPGAAQGAVRRSTPSCRRRCVPASGLHSGAQKPGSRRFRPERPGGERVRRSCRVF